MFHEDWYSEEQCNELKKLVNHIKNITEGDIAEIGCWEGKSTSIIANECYPDTVICIDTWLGNQAESAVTGVTHPTELIIKERDVYGNFIKNMDALTQRNYKVAKQDCIDWLKEYNGTLKFLHIDASHEYESVHETIRLALPKMKKGGILCGDDFLTSNITRNDLHGGIERAVRELLPGFQNIGNLWYYSV
jgi:predicted O-methyltransferase YrrM